MRARFALACGLLFFACGPLTAQTAGPAAAVGSASAQPENPVPTFHATSRLVLVDVVTSKHGDFVRGLKPGDFTLLEDGKQQRISAFSAHVASDAAQRMAPQVQLPPHQFTNFAAPTPDHPITIVLFDMLNTAFMDRPYARQQMIKFLSDMPSGQPVALFVLAEKLRMVQGFTQSSDALVAAAKGITDKNDSAHLITSNREMEDAAAIDELLMEASGLVPASPTSVVSAMEAIEVYQTDVRIRSTLAGFQALAQMVAGYTGRKNLIWLSGDFPVAFGPNFDVAFRPSITRSPHNSAEGNRLFYVDVLHETSSMLASSQIAVYPIGVRGLQTKGSGAAQMGSANIALSQDQRQTLARWNTEFTMSEIAKETGGEAFYNQNDLGNLMRRSLDEGTNYYTLAYVPQDHDWNGKYRKIEIKLTMEGTKLRFRNGYYALPDQPTDQKDAARLLAAAMLPTVPESTRLLLKVEVLPPDASRKSVSVDFAINPSDMIFVDGPEQRKQTVVDFMVVALGKDLKQAGLASNTVNATLRPEAYRQVLKTGFPGHLDLEVKPGKYLLRLGAIERNSQKIGTVDVPITVPVLQTATE